MQPFVDSMYQTVGTYLPSIGLALIILVGGWILALIISALVRKGLERVSFDDRLAERMGLDQAQVSIETIVGKVVYYIILLFVLVAVFQALRLTIVTQPLNRLLEELFAFGPNLLAAGGLILLAWILATGLRFIVSKLLGLTKLDDTLTQQAGLVEEGRPPMSETLGTIVYWFIWLLFLPAILGALRLDGLLAPIQGMLAVVLIYLPNIFASALILVVGWLVARVVRQIVTNFLAAIGTDSLGERVGLKKEATGGQSLSAVIGTVVYVLVLIPVIISALQALKIEAISAPATAMLLTLLNAIPSIFGAAVILGITYFVARLVASLVTSLLTSVGFNRILSLVGLGSEPQEGQRTPSEVVGYVVLVIVMLFAAIEAANLLGFGILADLVASFLVFVGQIALGVFILWIGLYLANLARNVVQGTAGAQAKLLSQAAWLAIVILTVAMGLRTMGIADDIINLAFGLLLGAIAIAVALAFGLGSREIASREVESLLDRVRSGDEE